MRSLLKINKITNSIHPILTMKYLLSIALSVLIAVNALSTAQIPEKINDNGIEKSLTKYLLELDSVSFSLLKERIPKQMTSTALWRNYIGHWKIKNDSLFLDSVLVMDTACDTFRFVPAKIDDIYSSRRTPSGYFADWVTDSLRIVSGDMIKYVHMGWNSEWKTEEFITVEGGVIKKRVQYNNRIVNPVKNDNSTFKKLIDSLNLGYVPGAITLSLKYTGFDENGTPTGYKVEIMRSSGDTAVDNKAMRAMSDLKVLQSILPVYYIQGQYKSPERTFKIPKSPETR